MATYVQRKRYMRRTKWGAVFTLLFILFVNVILPKMDSKNASAPVLDKSVAELLSSIEVEDGYEDYYDRNEYTSSSQYYVGRTGETYDSIRNYAYYESVHYQNGVYQDPYTNKMYDIKGLDYDHIIPLHYANLHGADNWSEEDKKSYADDPYIGVNVNAHSNRAKSDKGPSQWLPEENVEDYCYTWLVIAYQYDLSITQEDIDTIMNQLDGYSNPAIINGYK